MPSESRRGQRTLLALVLLASLVVRVGWGLALPADEEFIARLPDQREYLALGRSLLAGEGLKFVDPRFNDVVYAVRTPGYPLLVAACRGNLRTLRGVQGVIDTSTILAVYLLARRWLSREVSTLAAAGVGVNPFLIYFSGLALSETLFTALLAWGMCLLVRAGAGRPAAADGGAARWGTVGRWFGGAALLAVSVLVRQSALPLPVLLGLSAAFANRGGSPPYHRRWPVPAGATMLLLTLLSLFPWAYRNRQVLGTWVWTTTNGGITAYDGFHPDATGASDQTFVQHMPGLRLMGELGRDQFLAQEARAYVREHPRRAAELAGVKVARTWSPVPLGTDYSGLAYRLAALGYSLPFDAFVITGLIVTTRTGGLPRAAKVFLLVPAIYFTVVHALSVGSLRYRVPVEPPMAVLAAAGAAGAAGRLMARRVAVGDWKRVGRRVEEAA